jgi:hypothetical protein
VCQFGLIVEKDERLDDVVDSPADLMDVVAAVVAA